jgi:magnesium transporter
MLRSVYFPDKQTIKTDLAPEELTGIIQSEKGLLWVSLEQPNPNELETILRNTFHFHPLAIEDCTSIGYQAPKIDDFGGYLFLIVQALQRGDVIETSELNCFIGKNYLVTSHQSADMSPIKTVWKQLERDERIRAHGTDFLLHAILDALVDEYMPMLDDIDEELEVLEDQVLEHPQQDILERILDMKHRMIGLRRVINPQREVMNRLSRDDYALIDRQNRIYFRDIYDHLVRIQDLSEGIRDIISDSLDIYLSATSNRLNQVMKALTIVSTIFLPMSFFAGVYGMNFQHFPEITWKYGYAMAWGIFLIIPIGMLIFFKKRGWF